MYLVKKYRAKSYEISWVQITLYISKTKVTLTPRLVRKFYRICLNFLLRKKKRTIRDGQKNIEKLMNRPHFRVDALFIKLNKLYLDAS